MSGSNSRYGSGRMVGPAVFSYGATPCPVRNRPVPVVGPVFCAGTALSPRRSREGVTEGDGGLGFRAVAVGWDGAGFGAAWSSLRARDGGRVFSYGATPCPVRRRVGSESVPSKKISHGWTQMNTDRGCTARASDDRHGRTRPAAPRASVFICAHPWLKIPGPAQVKGAGGFFRMVLPHVR